MKQLTSFFLLFGLLLPFSSAQALDLLQIYELARQNDAQLMIAKSNLEASKQALPQARSSKKPQINLQGNAAYTDETNSLATVEDDQTISAGVSLNLTQSLYNRSLTGQVDAASAAIEQAQAQFLGSEQDLLVRVTEAYFAILSARDSVELAEAEKNAIGRQLEQAKKRFEVGLIAITDVKEAQASYDLSVSQEIEANNALDNAREAMAVIIGQPLSEPLKTLGTELALEIPDPQNRRSWVDAAEKNSLELIAARAALKAANENRVIARSSEGPTVDLLAGYDLYRIDSDNNGEFNTGEFSVGVQLNMPLYTGGATSASISKAEAEYSTAQNNLLLQKRLVAQNTNTAYLSVVAGIAQVNALKQSLISTTAALKATEAGFDVGTRTSVDVLNSLRETYASRRDYASSRYSYLINTLKLKQAAGILTEQDLTGINHWFAE